MNDLAKKITAALESWKRAQEFGGDGRMEEEVISAEVTTYFSFLLIETSKTRMGIDVDGVLGRIAEGKGAPVKGMRFMVGEVARLYAEGREAWLKGDLKTVAEMFGVLR